MSEAAVEVAGTRLSEGEDAMADADLLIQLKAWASAIAEVRAMKLGSRPLDESRYWHYFGCTD